MAMATWLTTLLLKLYPLPDALSVVTLALAQVLTQFIITWTTVMICESQVSCFLDSP